MHPIRILLHPHRNFGNQNPETSGQAGGSETFASLGKKALNRHQTLWVIFFKLSIFLPLRWLQLSHANPKLLMGVTTTMMPGLNMLNRKDRTPNLVGPSNLLRRHIIHFPQAPTMDLAL